MHEPPSSVWSGYHLKSLSQRQQLLKNTLPHLPQERELSCEVADIMVENCIGTMSLPLGLGLNLLVNDRPVIVPMAVEEPSIIAAVSGVSKLVSQCGGFSCTSSANIMIGQVHLVDLLSAEELLAAQAAIVAHKSELVALGNTRCTSMVQRGGGVVDVVPRIVGSLEAMSLRVQSGKRIRASEAEALLVVHIHINVCEAMGANIVNTVCEFLAPELLRYVPQARAALRILTNLCSERTTTATFRLPVSRLGYKGVSGLELAERILEAQLCARLDPHRAATHNKGVMNGIDAVAVAAGQDWRAIEAAAHAWAAHSGQYKPLTSYSLEQDDTVLVGELHMPIAVGVVGGALQTHPMYRYSMSLMGQPDAQFLAQIMVCVGLAQNFAALRALVTEGIQRGHMSLHARNVAVAAGSPVDLVPEVTKQLISKNSIDTRSARTILNHLTDNLPDACKPQ